MVQLQCIAGFFMNAAIDQQCELYIIKNGLEKEVNEKLKLYINLKEGFVQATKAIYQKEMMD
jgi:hypothetical protein